MSGTTLPAGSSGSPNFNIPYICPPNVPPNLIPFLQPIYNNFQNLIQTLIFSAGIAPRSAAQMFGSLNDPTAFLANNVHRFYCQALEPISFGAPITLVFNGPTLYVRNASAVGGLAPYGYCSQVGGLKGGTIGEVTLDEGMITGRDNNLIPGSIYYVGSVPGTYTNVAPTGTGVVAYPVAFAISATSMIFRAFNGLDGATKIPTVLNGSQTWNEYAGSSSIFTRNPIPTPPNIQSGLTVGDKDKLLAVINFGDYWGIDQNYDSYSVLQNTLLYCNLLALAMKNTSLDNNCYRIYIDLFLPRGQYLVSSPLIIPEYVRLTGPGLIVRCPYVGAQSGGTLVPGTFYSTSITQPGIYYPTVVVTPRAHLGVCNVYTGNANTLFRGSGVAIGKYWAQQGGTSPTIGAPGTGYAVNDIIYAPSPQQAPYFGCSIKVTSVNGSGGVTGAIAYKPGAYGLPANLQRQQWTSANGFNVFDPARAGYFIQSTTSGSGSGCTFLPTWAADFAGGSYNFGAYGYGSPLQTDTQVDKINISGSMLGEFNATYGSTYCVMVMGLNGIINEIEGLGGNVGLLFRYANDYRVGHVNFVLSGTGVQLYSSGSIEITNAVIDTCGCAAVIDESSRIILHGMVFFEQGNLGGPVYPDTQGYAILIGSASNATYLNIHLDIDLTLVNMGGIPNSTLVAFPSLVTNGNVAEVMTASMYLAYCKDSRIKLLISNWDETGQFTSYLPTNGFVEFHSGVDASVMLEGEISLITGPACVGSVSSSPCGVRIWDAVAGGYAGTLGTYDLKGTATPTSGVSGTGAGKAGTGSTYMCTTTGVSYRNTGTLASPTWT